MHKRFQQPLNRALLLGGLALNFLGFGAKDGQAQSVIHRTVPYNPAIHGEWKPDPNNPNKLAEKKNNNFMMYDNGIRATWNLADLNEERITYFTEASYNFANVFQSDRDAVKAGIYPGIGGGYGYTKTHYKYFDTYKNPPGFVYAAGSYENINKVYGLAKITAQTDPNKDIFFTSSVYAKYAPVALYNEHLDLGAQASAVLNFFKTQEVLGSGVALNIKATAGVDAMQNSKAYIDNKGNIIGHAPVKTVLAPYAQFSVGVTF